MTQFETISYFVSRMDPKQLAQLIADAEANFGHEADYVRYIAEEAFENLKENINV